MSKPIATAARTKEILKQFNLHAKKGFGQNFLIDTSVVARCAEAGVIPGAAVMEIGPGIGSLTEQLALRAAHVTAFEVDESLPAVLSETLKDYSNVEVVLQDFLQVDVKSVVEQLRKTYGDVTVVANLPYYITTPVLFKIFACGASIPKITVMVQKEVADRFSAKPNSSDYGALSAESQLFYEVRKLFNVPSTCFNPAPKVDSAIVQFTRKCEIPTVDEAKVYELIQACFKQRRKTLYNNLKEVTGSGEKALALLTACGLSEKTRAQELSGRSFLDLYHQLENNE